jgi:hypothetical protein
MARWVSTTEVHLGHPVDSVLRGLVVKRLALLFAVALLGCGSAGEPVSLLTSAAPCYLDWTLGLLSVDPTYGTQVKDEGGDPPGSVSVVMWPPGYTGRRDGAEVSVLDPNGAVVATTGHRYKIRGGFSGPFPPAIPIRAFAACGSAEAVP